jgi:hypothetical protein
MAWDEGLQQTLVTTVTRGKESAATTSDHHATSEGIVMNTGDHYGIK